MAENAILDRVQAGDLRAIAIFLKISERRSKLFGLDVSNIPLLDALQVLVNEKVLPIRLGQVILKGIAELEESLREEGVKNEEMQRKLRQFEEASESGA